MSRAGGIFFFFFFPLSLRKCRIRNMRAEEKSYIELIILYCILSLLDSGALNTFGVTELMMSTPLHTDFSQATAGKQRGEPKKGHASFR